MAYTQEQIDSLKKIQTQLKTPEDFQNYVTQNYGADKLQEIKTNLQQIMQPEIGQQDTQTLTQDQLKQKIATGNFNASETRQYNQMTGNNQGARELALGSQQAVQNMQTTITPEETAKMAQAGITNVGEGVKPDMTSGTKEDFKQAIQPTETTPTGTIKTTETPTGTPKIESIEQFKQAGGGLSNLEQLVENRYGTVATQNPDGSLTAEINGEKFKWTLDSAGNPIKQSLGKVGVEEMKQTQIDPNNLFNQIRSGQVPTKDIQNTDEYKKSKQRADNLARFENMSAKDLSYSINNGDLLPGTQTYNDLKAIRPDLIAEAEKLNALNSALTTTEKSNTDVLTKITEQIFKIFNGDTTTLKTKLSENPEVVKLNTDMVTKKNELNSLKDNINNAYRDIEKELSGTGATKGYIQALASRRTEDLTRDYNTKLNEYNTMAGQLQTITEMVGDELQQEEKLQAKQLQALQFAYGIAKDETDYQRSLQAEQRQREYQKAQDIQNFEQQKEIMKLQQDYQNANIQTDIIQVGNKNVLINTKTGETIKSFDMPTEAVKPESLIKMGEDSIYDPNTRTWITTPKVGNVTPGTTQNRPDRNNNPGNLKAGDVGYGVDDQNHTIFGSAEEGYQAMVRDITAKMTGNTRTGLGPNSTLAQLGKVYAEDPNWAKAVSKLSGYSLDTKLSQIDVNKLAPAIAKQEGFTGSINTGGQPTGKQYSDEQISDLAYVTELLEKTPTEGRKALKEMGYTDKDIANYKAGNIPLTEKQKNSSFEVVNGIQDLISNYDWNDAVGKFDYSRVLGLQGAEDAKIAIDNLVAKLTLPNLGVLKGPMSDKDIEFIKAASSKLGTTQSNKSFEKNLIDAYNIAARRAGIKEVKTLNEIKTGTSNINTTGTSTQYGGKVYNFKP